MFSSSRIAEHLRSNVVGYIALFVATTGVSWAAQNAPKNSVISKSIKAGQVKTSDLGKNAATGAKVKESTLVGVDADELDGLDSLALQKRITTDCGDGAAIRSVAANGTAVCESGGLGDITGVAAGSGLSGGGTEGDVSLAINPAQTQARVANGCPATGAIGAISQAGTATCNSFPTSLPPSGAAAGALAGTYPNPTLAPPPAWQDITFATGWSNFPGVGASNVQCYKDALGVVHLRGVARKAAGATSAIGSLPVVCRPTGTFYELVFPQVNSIAVGTGVGVGFADFSGALFQETTLPPDGGGVGFDGISYRP